jgi:hypothetical protein
MSKDIHQGLIIESLNNYLKWNNLPFTMNESGICHGLAIVYAKMHAQGRDEDFKKILGYIAGTMRPDLEMATQLNHFIADLLISFDPVVFDKQLSQEHGPSMIGIGGKALKTPLKIAMTLYDDDWAELIEELDLKDKETFLVSSVYHSVSVSKQDGVYTVYDPNYIKGFKTFNNENSLVKELHENVFRYKKGPIGLYLSIITSPMEEQRQLPKQIDLYKQYVKSDHVFLEAEAKESGKSVFNTLVQSASFCDVDVCNYLINIGADHISEATKKAISKNNYKVVPTLLTHIKRGSDLIEPIGLALLCGRKESFDAIMESEHGEAMFCELIDDQSMRLLFIRYAAEGGNDLLLMHVTREIIEDIKSKLKEQLKNQYL